MIKKIIVFIGSILACIGSLILLILLTLLASKIYYANDMQQDFSIKSLEQADIYFSKYLDYAKTVVDEYNPNYELTTEMIMQDEDRQKHFSSNFVFNDKFSLYISVTYDLSTPRFSEYCSRARCNSHDYNDIELFPREIFDVMNKIDEYCVYKLGGDVNTYNTLFNEVLTKVNVDEKAGGDAYKHFYNMRNKNYKVEIVWKEYLEQWQATVWQTAFLTDKNVLQ